MKNLFLLALIGIILIACQSKPKPAAKPLKKHDWIPTECAPENYPVQIYRGYFYYGKKGSIYIPDGKVVNNGWGEDGSLHAAGDQYKEAPDTLELSWRSFTENKDYEGKFKLNTLLIDSLLNTGFPNEDIQAGHDRYDYIKVGMAPGGLVVLWLSGAGHQVEVGSYQARETKRLDWKAALPDMAVSMYEYGKYVIKKLPDSVKQHKIPYEKWRNWRKRYYYKPQITGTANITSATLFYFNNEMDRYIGRRLKAISSARRAAMDKMYIFWTDKQNETIRIQINFNEQVIYQLLNQIKPDEEAQLIVNIDNTGKINIKIKTPTRELPVTGCIIDSFVQEG